jgi:hypothetical protein
VTRYAVALLALALSLSACGGGHEAKPRLTVKAFRAQANAVCAETTTHTGRLNGLRELRPPLQDDDLYSRWLKAERDATEGAKPSTETVPEPPFDMRTPLTIAEGKIAGYARRLGASRCE